MFRHLCSACEEVVGIVLRANGRSVPVYVFYQVSVPRSIQRRNGTLLKRESESIDDRTKVSMIGHLVLLAEENTGSSKSILRYTLMSIAYPAISRTEPALLVHLQNLRANEAGSRPLSSLNYITKYIYSSNFCCPCYVILIRHYCTHSQIVLPPFLMFHCLLIIWFLL